MKLNLKSALLYFHFFSLPHRLVKTLSAPAPFYVLGKHFSAVLHILEVIQACEMGRLFLTVSHFLYEKVESIHKSGLAHQAGSLFLFPSACYTVFPVLKYFSYLVFPIVFCNQPLS